MKQIAMYPPNGGDPVYVGGHKVAYYQSLGWTTDKPASKHRGRKTKLDPAPEPAPPGDE